MKTLKILATETYNYKGATIERTDKINQADTWTLGASLEREWRVNNQKAFTINCNGEIKLAVYLEKSAYYGGKRTILMDFNPACGFYPLFNEEIKSELEKLDRIMVHEVTETDF